MVRIKRIAIVGHFFLTLVKKRHFVVTLVVLLAVIAWAGAIFWKQVHLATNAAPDTNPALLKVNRENAQRLQELLKEREASFAGVTEKAFPNIFR